MPSKMPRYNMVEDTTMDINFHRDFRATSYHPHTISGEDTSLNLIFEFFFCVENKKREEKYLEN